MKQLIKNKEKRDQYKLRTKEQTQKWQNPHRKRDTARESKCESKVNACLMLELT